MSRQTRRSLTTVQTTSLFQDYILTVITVDFQLGTLFFVRSLRLVFIYHCKKKFLVADPSCDRSYCLSNGRDRRANVQANGFFYMFHIQSYKIGVNSNDSEAV